MQMAEPIRIITRALFLRDDRVLIARFEERPYSFLPGGEINPGESATVALTREMREELGIECTIGRIVSVIEHAFEENDRRQQEINLVFETRAEHMTYPERPASRESDLSFVWQSVGELDEVNLKPWPMQTIIREYMSGKPVTPWMTTMES